MLRITHGPLHLSKHLVYNDRFLEELRCSARHRKQTCGYQREKGAEKGKIESEGLTDTHRYI